MKWILSPSKTQQMKGFGWQNEGKPEFEEEAERLVKTIQTMIREFGTEDFGKRLKIKEAQLEAVCGQYQNWDSLNTLPAIERYTGSVFKGMDLKGYNEEQKAYLRNHVRIMSALYGILKPFDGIKPYRLDMTSKVFEKSAYHFWAPIMGHYFSSCSSEQPEQVINLASTEFSQMLSCPMLTLEFKEIMADGTLVVKSTYAKMARGRMMDYAIRNQIQEIDAIKKFDWGGYTYREMYSDESTLVFAR